MGSGQSRARSVTREGWKRLVAASSPRVRAWEAKRVGVSRTLRSRKPCSRRVCAFARRTLGFHYWEQVECVVSVGRGWRQSRFIFLVHWRSAFEKLVASALATVVRASLATCTVAPRAGS